MGEPFGRTDKVARNLTLAHAYPDGPAERAGPQQAQSGWVSDIDTAQSAPGREGNARTGDAPGNRDGVESPPSAAPPDGETAGVGDVRPGQVQADSPDRERDVEPERAGRQTRPHGHPGRSGGQGTQREVDQRMGHDGGQVQAALGALPAVVIASAR